MARAFNLEAFNQLLGQTGLTGSDKHTCSRVCLVILSCDLTHKPCFFFFKHPLWPWPHLTARFKPNITNIHLFCNTDTLQKTKKFNVGHLVSLFSDFTGLTGTNPPALSW